MSKAIHELLNNETAAASRSLEGVQGDFPMDEAVLEGWSLTYLHTSTNMPC